MGLCMHFRLETVDKGKVAENPPFLAAIDPGPSAPCQ